MDVRVGRTCPQCEGAGRIKSFVYNNDYEWEGCLRCMGEGKVGNVKNVTIKRTVRTESEIEIPMDQVIHVLREYGYPLPEGVAAEDANYGRGVQLVKSLRFVWTEIGS